VFALPPVRARLFVVTQILTLMILISASSVLQDSWAAPDRTSECGVRDNNVGIYTVRLYLLICR
jgi:hypothetical protein